VRRLALLLLGVSVPAQAGVECLYDVELFAGGKPSSTSTVTLLVEGAQLRVEGAALPGPFVLDDDAKEASWFVPEKKACYRLPYARLGELAARALEVHQRAVRSDADLTKAERDRVLAADRKAVADARKPKPGRMRTLAWKSSEKLEFACELYDVTEGKENVGQICLQLEGRPPRSLTVPATTGEWWQSVSAFFQAGRVPVLVEGKRAGSMQHRVTLRKKVTRPLDASLFSFGLECRPGLDDVTER
jgi:hypothetical protein